ncbi:MAG TPA: IMP dehydrogenase [Prolixibacteraceae bacterium]|nr:IMP dehydrogenase [Prolixibacteraceae bacterium]HPR84689.1 IMP dehydrogenase [Prolixibacteraceae bacterium]
MSFFADKVVSEGLTFDDVLLIPSYSDVLPREVELSTWFTQNIRLNTPIVSAAMDTVTESMMAIAIARGGGIGVIHKNMSITAQAAQVATVKRAENGMIYDPVTISKEKTVREAIGLMRVYKIGGIPVVENDGVLVGIITNRDLRFETDMNKKVSEVMTKENLITTNASISLESASEILQKYKIEKLPVVDNANKLVALITYKDITKAKDNPLASKDGKGRLRVAAAVGIAHDTIDRIDELVSAQVDAIVVDTAHGHSKYVLDMLRKGKSKYPEIDFVAGNIATAEAATDLVLAGADAVKVGIGPGSICTTRIVAGVGIPQLTAVYNVSKAIKKSGVPVIADGGIRYSGDIVKALAAGAQSIMAGSLFAGVDESPGDTVLFQGRKFKTYRGMGSVEAMQTGSKDRYFQDMEDDIKKLVPEGIVGRVPYKGSLAEVLHQLTGGIRSGMGYCGAKNIETLQHAKFIKITNSGIQESHPHDVSITSESPNYSSRQ